jgi:hypothetical protein
VMVAIKPRPTASVDAPPQPLDMTRIYVAALRDGIAGSGIRSVAARLDGEPLGTLLAANVQKPTPPGHAAYYGFDIGATRLGAVPHELSVAVTVEGGRTFTMDMPLLPGEATVEERVFLD